MKLRSNREVKTAKVWFFERINEMDKKLRISMRQNEEHTSSKLLKKNKPQID